MDQHYVPNGYLKAWCDPETPAGHTPYVWRFDKDGTNPKKKGPENIFFEPNMYDFKGQAGEEFSYESLMKEIEDAFYRVRNEVIEKSNPLSVNDKHDLYLFAAAMHARNPESRGRLKEFFADIKEKEDWIIENKMTRPGQAEKHRSSQEYLETVENATNPHKRLLPMFIETQYKVYVQFNLRVTLFYTPTSPGFITSDAPVTAWDSLMAGRGFPFNSPGVASPGFELKLPISPRFLMCLHHQKLPTYYDLDEAAVDEFNRATRWGAEKYFVVRKNLKKDIWFDPGTPPPERAAGQ